MNNYGCSQPEITYVNRRAAYRNEALEPSGMHRSMTQEERQALVERHFERGELRQIESDLYLRKAIELGCTLKRLRGEG
ncbi:hypothetical protein [Ciceribacter thiooxidans]|uniref:Uncharacterized protein n=1 Tax=Ciceribacter thiooxidans TaxID=1969821 RepID=A0ABV7HYG8_9HYPH|nr:hypothetical protein [Ciceribacter thiooxidans]